MSDSLGKQAVVIGAGMAGLTAARALADHFDQVIVLENDALPRDAAPRPGTPQSQHAHAILAGGLQALAALFPGFERSLHDAGAVPVCVASDYLFERPGYDPFPSRDFGILLYSMSRPLIESVVRNRIAAIGNIEVREGCRAQRLITTGDGTLVHAVSCGHRRGEIEDVSADLLIDASGHGLLTLNLMAALGRPAPPETTVGVDIAYTSAIFEIPDDAPSDWKALITLPDPPKNRRGVFVFPLEDHRWIVSLTGRYEAKAPCDEAGFLAHAKQQRTPTVSNAIRNAKRRSEIAQYGFKANRWRHFEKLADFPRGLLPFGDTICRFNPVWGQGMSVAAQEACLLQRLLSENARGGKSLHDVASAFLADVPSILDAPWATAVIPDFLDPLTQGDRPANLENSLKSTAALIKLASEDAEVHRLVIEVGHLLKPRSVLAGPEIEERVRAMMAEA